MLTAAGYILLNWKSGLKMMWQMPFNVSKCKNLHMGRTNPNHVYSIAGCNIEQNSLIVLSICNTRL